MPLSEHKRRKALANPLSEKFINERRTWRDRLLENSTAMPFKQLIRETVALAELQALTKDATGEPLMLMLCSRIATEWPGGLTAEEQFADNPEPYVIRLARIAELNGKASDILDETLIGVLSKIHFGTHGWNSNYGKISLCRARIIDAVGMSNSPLFDYGSNRGLNWILDNVYTPEGWNRDLFGSPWYAIFNNAVIEMGWDHRRHLTPERLAKFNAIYRFPFYWQAGGASPLVGEDATRPAKTYPLWTGWARNWRGTDRLSHYMRSRALTELGVATHFSDLFCPVTPDNPPAPPLPAFNVWPGIAVITRDKARDVVTWTGDKTLALPGTHHQGDGKVSTEIVINP